MDELKRRETETQLEIWGTEIDRRAAVLVPADGNVSFAVLQHFDELKILHATARATLDALTAPGTGEQPDLEEDFAAAWDELAAAVGEPLPQ